MNKFSSVCAVLGLMVAATIPIGCSHKTDAKSELEKATVVIAKDEPAQTSAAVPTQPSTSPQTDPVASPVAVPAATPSQEMKQALVAYKAGNLEDAVTRLHKLRSTAVLSPEQRMALQDAVAAVMAEVYSMADKGDARAIQAVRQYEEMQTRPR